MFFFKDLGGRDVALRPEFTASVARVVATTLRNEPKPFRLFSVGSIYRYDEPQRGRYREFWQSNYELMGSSRPEADAEIISVTNALMEANGLKKLAFKIGHVGVLRGIFDHENLDDKVQNGIMQLMDKKQYEDALKLVEKTGASKACLDVLRRLVKTKGEQIFDLVDEMKECVKNYTYAVEAAENLHQILTLISESESNINIIVDAGFARGLEYYTGMIFEVYIPDLNIALGGGGRYDKLIETYGGDSTPAVGVAHGLDRIMLAMHSQKTHSKSEEENMIIVIPINDELRSEALKIAAILRKANVPVEVEVMGRKMANALEDADRRKMTRAVIIGERELKEQCVVVRNLTDRKQETVKIEDLVKVLRK
jgi:histidyl-tRNA synthetase